MIRAVVSISILLSLISCAHRQSEYQTVSIRGVDMGSQQVIVRGMGVTLSGGDIITSAHVVRDDRLRYDIGDMIYRVVERDTMRDIALLSQDKNPSSKIPNMKTPQKGDPIYIEVNRSGSIVRLTGKVIDPSISLSAYDTTGRMISLSGIVLTDIDLLPGDSGSPIFTTDRELVDLVHVR